MLTQVCPRHQGAEAPAWTVRTLFASRKGATCRQVTINNNLSRGHLTQRGRLGVRHQKGLLRLPHGHPA